MAQATPILTFETSVRSKARPEDVYGLLADLQTHLEWAGEQGRKDFRILTLEAPSGAATKGTEFTSTGANSKDGKVTFHDRSVVTEASRGKRFAFTTESTLPRPHRPTWQARFVHNYELTPDGSGTTIGYTCGVFPQNYRPWWLHPMVRPMTRKMVTGFITKHLENLVTATEKKAARSR